MRVAENVHIQGSVVSVCVCVFLGSLLGEEEEEEEKQEERRRGSAGSSQWRGAGGWLRGQWWPWR